MAHLKNFVSKLEQELECSICHEILNQPKTLQCFHSFCLKCLEGWNGTCRDHGKRLTCPTCLTPVELNDEETVSKLKSSFHLGPLKELLLAMRKNSEQDKLNCVSCDKEVNLVAFCFQCDGMVCLGCKNAHNSVKTLREEHQVTLLGELDEQHLNIFISNQQRCLEKHHKKSKLEYYCQTCRKCICQRCTVTGHNTHNKTAIEDKVEELKHSIYQDLERVNGQKQKFKQELELSKQNRSRLETEIVSAKKEVTDQVQAQIKMLEAHQDAIIRDLDDILGAQKTANDNEQEEISAAIQKLEDLDKQGKALQHQNVPLHFILERQFPRRCEKLLENSRSILKSKSLGRNKTVRYIPAVPATPATPATPAMPGIPAISGIPAIPGVPAIPDVPAIPGVPAIQAMPGIPAAPLMPGIPVGTIKESIPDPSRCSVIESQTCLQGGDQSTREFKITTRDFNGDVCYTNQGSIDVQIQDADMCEVVNELTHVGLGEFDVTVKAPELAPYKILVFIGGEAINDSPLTFYGKNNFQPTQIFGEKGDGDKDLNGPWSLALGSNGDVIIADNGNHRIVTFSGSGEYLRQFGSHGTGDGELYRPLGVVMLDNNILVCDNPDKKYGRIQEFSRNGAYLRTIARLERVVLHGICITDKYIAVCSYHRPEKNKSGIKLLSKHSAHEIIKEIPTVAKAPFDIAYGNHKIFVSYYDQTDIGVYDENGAVLYTFQVIGYGNGSFGVKGLAVYNTGLLVCDANNHCVQVLTHQGEFLTSFGSHGSDIGQMNAPSDVVVTLDGKVLVLESKGKRVQVWK